MTFLKTETLLQWCSGILLHCLPQCLHPSVPSEPTSLVLPSCAMTEIHCVLGSLLFHAVQIQLCQVWLPLAFPVSFLQNFLSATNQHIHISPLFISVNKTSCEKISNVFSALLCHPGKNSEGINKILLNISGLIGFQKVITAVSANLNLD